MPLKTLVIGPGFMYFVSGLASDATFQQYR